MKKYSKKTLEDISTLSGIPKGTLNKLFSGQTKDPQLSTIRAVTHCLGFTLDDLSSEFPLNDGIISGESEVQDEGKSLYIQLDDIDKAEIRGEIKQMLKAEKYSQNSIVEISNEICPVYDNGVDIEKELAEYRLELEAEKRGKTLSASHALGNKKNA